VCLAVAAVIAWFFQWTVNPSGKTAVLSDNGNGCYNLLTQGFLKGQTAIDREVDAGMLAVKDPYDPRQRAGRGMHDASYFQGRYFIYFGATPAVAIFVPVKILTGKFLDDRLAVCAFAIAGFWVAALLMRDVRRRSCRVARQPRTPAQP